METNEHRSPDGVSVRLVILDDGLFVKVKHHGQTINVPFNLFEKIEEDVWAIASLMRQERMDNARST